MRHSCVKSMGSDERAFEPSILRGEASTLNMSSKLWREGREEGGRGTDEAGDGGELEERRGGFVDR